MILAVPLLFLGALTFVEQDLCIVSHGSYGGSGGDGLFSRRWEYRHADIDGDGHVDLLLPAEVCFQRNGAFPPEARVLTPGAKEKASVDCFGGVLYLRYPDRLALCKWEDGAWQTIQEQRISWPKPAPEDSSEHADKGCGQDFARLERFLTDVDSDNVPEILLPGEYALHFYRCTGGVYAETARWDVFPPLKVRRGYTPALWPESRRSIAMPVRQRSFRYAVTGNRLMVVNSEFWWGSDRRFEVIHYRIEAAQGFAAIRETGSEETAGPFPDWISCPCRMNGETPLDYAGWTNTLSEASAFPLPLIDISVAMDGGKTRQTFRTQESEVDTPFTDFNEDGRLDLVTWSSDLYDGGLRETVNRFLNGSKATQEVRIYLQDAQGGFSKTPEVSRRFALDLGKPIARGGRYLGGWMCNVNGDFNGDGRHDAAVRVEPERIAVYLCEGAAFPTQPEGFATVEEKAWFGVDDVDGDGRSDIIVWWWERDKNTPRIQYRVYLTRESAP